MARTTGYRFVHARLTPWPASQRHPQPLIRPCLTFPRLILIERFGPLGPPRTSPRPILIERLGPPRTPVAVRFPSVSVLSPSVADTPCPTCQCSPARARALGRRSNLGRRFLI